jgi:hypothetical protein
MSTSTSNLYVLLRVGSYIEECLTLLINIQKKMNQNNQNVQWISTEERDEGRNINIVMRGGDKT